MTLENISYKEVKWDDLIFATWLRKQDPKWTFKNIGNTIQYIGNKEIIATVQFHRIPEEPFIKRVFNVREDLF